MFNLDEILGGAFSEKFNDEIKKVWENITDPNVESSKKRKMTITIDFVPDKNDDEIVYTTFNFKLSLAPSTPVSSQFIVDKDINGVVHANEFCKNVVKNQISFDECNNSEFFNSDDIISLNNIKNNY